MKTVVYLSQPSLHDQVVQALSTAKLLDKVEVKNHPFVSQQTKEQLREPIKIPVQNFHLDRQQDGTLLCRENGRMIPVTPKGKPDWEKLAVEIAQKRW